jgi:F-box/TPR repeat protein Pof3
MSWLPNNISTRRTEILHKVTCWRVALPNSNPRFAPRLYPLSTLLRPCSTTTKTMARTRSPEEYQEIGKSYYKLKQYEKAIEAFTNGIDASAIPSATLYDYRAATHEKLGDFNAAVKDGRLTIRTHKQDVKGYLRTASALQKMDKLDTALSIYKYGMKNVPVSNKDFPLLQQLHNKLTRTVSPPKAIDPFAVLPVELVEMVIGYLSFKNMVSCLRVSRGWKDYLTHRPKIWANIDLSGATKPVSRTFFANAVRYSRGSLHTLTVHRMHHTDMLRNIATACKSLHTLTILSFPFKISDTLIGMAQSAQNLRRVSVHTEITSDTMGQILRRRPDLELFDCKSISASDADVPIDWKGGPYSRLQTLALQGNADGRPPRTFIQSLIRQTPEIRSLTCLNMLIRSPDDITLRLCETRLTSIVLKKINIVPIFPSTLRHLVYFPVIPPTVLNGVRNSFRHSCSRSLTHVSFGNHVDLWPDFLSKLLDFYVDADGAVISIEDGKPLQHIALAGMIETNNADGTPSTLASVPPRTLVSTYLATSPRILTRSLTSLELPGQPLTDDDIAPITESTRLTTIDVSNTNISGFGIKKLVDGAPTLRYINADHCRNLSSRDVIDYAKERGVHVSYTMAEPSAGAKGRKVRYG